MTPQNEPFREHASHALRRAVELLSDGQWHDFEEIRFQVGLNVPPGKAKRTAEATRLKTIRIRLGIPAGEEVPPEFIRHKRTDQQLIASGRKHIALDILAARRFEVDRSDPKNKKVRLAPPKDPEAVRRQRSETSKKGWETYRTNTTEEQRAIRSINSQVHLLRNIEAEGYANPKEELMRRLNAAKRKKHQEGKSG